MLTESLRRLRSLLRGGREDAETEQELRFHLEMETEKNRAAGMDAREARRRAHLRVAAARPALPGGPGRGGVPASGRPTGSDAARVPSIASSPPTCSFRAFDTRTPTT